MTDIEVAGIRFGTVDRDLDYATGRVTYTRSCLACPDREPIEDESTYLNAHAAGHIACSLESCTKRPHTDKAAWIAGRPYCSARSCAARELVDAGFAFILAADLPEVA